jgi:hypothetical protein
MAPLDSLRGAPCLAGGSLRKVLRRTFSVLSREFSLTENLPVLPGECLAIRKVWDKFVASCAMSVRDRKQKRFLSSVKGCKRLFDLPCSRCDDVAAEEARKKWADRVAGDYTLGNTVCRFYTERLKRHVRELAGGWGKRLEACRKDTRDPYLLGDVYVPDQQGCLELEAGLGGTLGVSDSDCGRDWSLVRRGVAKQKGKYRVVTMQSARVKRVLRPVHNAIYDFLSESSWLVRGDVEDADFLAVRDSSEEELISGDFDSSTDMIYLPAVEAIVEVLAEDPRLTSEEREVLLGSFTNLRWRSRGGRVYPINRGSMMGNLCSFTVLCLLNKACHDIAAEEVYGRECRRVGRFNGDDCLFAGSHEMYEKWRKVTSIYGFVVNESKTLRSNRWADLNSQTFDLRRRNRVPKPVLSFFLPTSAPGEVLSSVLSGSSSFRFDVQQWIVNVLMRYEICLRGFSLSSVPSRWVRVLVVKKWFRRCVYDGPADVEDPLPRLGFGEKPRLLTSCRLVPSVLGNPPIESAMSTVTEICSQVTRSMVDAWSGISVIPKKDRLDRRAFRKRYDSPPLPLPPTRFVGVAVRWAFLWPKTVYDVVSEQYPFLLLSDHDCLIRQSYRHSPLLTLRHDFRVVRQKQQHPIPFPPLANNSPRYSPFLPPHLLQY